MFAASISHQHDAVRKELVYCITNLLDQFATTSYEADEEELLHDLMAALRSRGLWPIWPVGARSTPLQEQLAAFSSLEIPIVSQKYKSRSPRATNLTSRNLICLSDRLNDLCDGLCLDCLKGRDRCGWSARHPPDPWEKYEADRKRVFEQRKRYPSSSRSTRSSRAGSPGRDLWDENMFHVVDDGMWDLA